MKTLICYGDSNTYGYDPSDIPYFRYPIDKCWTYLVQQKLGEGWQIVNEGLNGRMLPDLRFEGAYVSSLIDRLGGKDCFAVMLGTNDILLTGRPNADIPIAKMEKLLSFIDEKRSAAEEGGFPEIIIIAPPYIGKGFEGDAAFMEEGIRMNKGFKVLAENHNVTFIDAGAWNVPLSFDEVHFSEEGHRVFAEKLVEIL